MRELGSGLSTELHHIGTLMWDFSDPELRKRNIFCLSQSALGFFTELEDTKTGHYHIYRSSERVKANKVRQSGEYYIEVSSKV